MTPLHLGAMHPVEQALTLLLAFGPFVVLGVVVVVRRRADERAERESAENEQAPEVAGEGQDYRAR
ncbi:hypothetical protein [Nocardioides rubriscoriae]|uniref:hypothetical protein n=1 Tax=Nocardioides rubriscoriae TaxID=642762 RepID=UPI0011DF5A47|nr:hypothetical protein [Nocardioides rubriscoriae]